MGMTTTRDSSQTVDRTLSFGCDLMAARAARIMLGDDLARSGWRGLDVDRAQLAASELVANAVVHARTPVGIHYVVDGTVRIEVTDDDPGSEPVPRTLDAARPGGMGLALVARFSSAWGIERTCRTKTVWCEIEPGQDDSY